MKNSYITVTDQFCGAGGSSIGASSAGAEIKLAMNHWKLAIETHNTNFPNVDHDCTDISAVDPRRYPSTDILITSPECTNHSLAKGKPRRYYDADLWGNKLLDPAEERSRATMWDVPRFAEYHDYRIIVVENVVDVAKWRLWDAWLIAMHALGYDHECVYFNSMFAHPTPQSRDRLYTVFWKRGNRRPDLDFRPAAYCDRCGKTVQAIQTWKKRVHWGRYKAQYFYRCPDCSAEITPFYYAAFNAIDWSIPALRIGERRDHGKPELRPKTMARVQYGFDRYGHQPLIVTGRYTSGIECRVKNAMQEPIPTESGQISHAVVFPWMVETEYTGDKRIISSAEPAITQTSRQSSAVVMPYMVRTVRQDSGGSIVGGNEPLSTRTTCQDVGVIAPAFIADMRGTSLAHGIDDTLMCVTANGNHHALLSSNAFLTYYYGTLNASGITDPMGTVSTRDRVGVVGALGKMTVNDLTFRMMVAREIGAAMAFPKTYIVLGNGREQVKQYGNAVTPPPMGKIIDACMETLR